MKTKLLLTMIAILHVSHIKSQELKFTVESINEERNSYHNEDEMIQLKFKVEGLNADRKNKIYLDTVTAAADNLGNQLEMIDYAEISGADNMKLSISLSLPARDADEISYIDGELVFYEPTVENGSLFDITEFNTSKTKNLMPPNEAEVEIYQLTLEEYTAACDSILQVDVKKILENETDPKVQKQSINEVMKQKNWWLESFKTGESVFFQIKNIDDVGSIRLMDSEGKSIYSRRVHVGGFYGFKLEEDLKKGDMLRVTVPNEKSMTKISFCIENIKLP